MAANVFVIAGIIVALFQFFQSKRSEKVQNAINAINQTRSDEFLKAYARLKTAYNTGQAADQVTLIDDLNYVTNTYDNTALLYINDLADRCVIRKAMFSTVQELASIYDKVSVPKEYRQNIDKFLDQMKNENCD
ncbi:MAG TPA: hypothetical protein VJU86_01980 [Pyrinomonadaceae bacterium]|nr:hypothetical protein [Pyrinomonadaceae bacterium]